MDSASAKRLAEIAAKADAAVAKFRARLAELDREAKQIYATTVNAEDKRRVNALRAKLTNG